MSPLCISCCCNSHFKNHGKDSSSVLTVYDTVTTEQLRLASSVDKSLKDMAWVVRWWENICNERNSTHNTDLWGKNFEEEESNNYRRYQRSVTNWFGWQAKAQKFNDGFKFILMSVDRFLHHGCAEQTVQKTATGKFDRFSTSLQSGGY